MSEVARTPTVFHSPATATATFHWRVLRESGITREHKVGRYKAVELRREDLDARFPHLLDAVLAATPPARGSDGTPTDTPESAHARSGSNGHS
ncbi:MULTISPECIES: hypothetical protein [unclassified Streptomyces]|uniref:hypothetical protein n=1 Tax=unclassified Streptomyces TaxID=2593676 RepID=UPI003648E98F